MPAAVAPPSPAAAPREPWHKGPLDWIKANPGAAALSLGVAAVVGFFYFGVPLYGQRLTTFDWAWSSWNPETRYEHAKLVPLIIAFLVWNDLPKLRAAAVRPSDLGWAPIVLGILFFLMGARTLQPRIALFALPFLCLGISLYLGGRQITRVLLFPIACLLFLIPLPGIDQATVRLQLFVTVAAKVLCGWIGIPLIAIGTTLRAADKSFQFEIIGDCSGINSLMAITLMTAIFAHLTQNRLWKKLVLFAASVPVAVIGNIARITAVMIVARCFGQEIAGGWFHEISAYVVSFPFAFGALCLVHKALNWKRLPPNGRQPASAELPPAPSKTVSYDY